MSASAELTDTEVVRRIRRGDREVYRVLVRRYQNTLFRFAVSMVGEPDVAADLVQATFIAGYQKLSKLRDGARFGGWIYRMCMNRCRDHLKSRRRRDISLDDSPPHVITAPDRADGDLERWELGRVLDGALATLREDHREAFILKHVEGYGYEEMSAMLKTPIPALKMRVHRAREALKEALEEVL